MNNTPTQKPVLPEEKKLFVLIDGHWRPVKKIVLEDFAFTDGMFPIVDFKYGSKESAITTAREEERKRIDEKIELFKRKAYFLEKETTPNCIYLVGNKEMAESHQYKHGLKQGYAIALKAMEALTSQGAS